MGLLDFDLANILGDFLTNIYEAFFEPIWVLIYGIFSALITLVNNVLGLIGDIFSLGQSVLNFISSFLGLFFFDTWTTIIMTQISLIIFLRGYYFIKGMKIAGTGV